MVDIGANVGVFTVYAAKQTKNRVFSFEPLPSNCDYLQQNIKVNNLDNVTFNCEAVSDQQGVEKLYMSDSVAGNLLFDHNIEGKLERYIEVSCTTLQALMDRYDIPEIGFLKLDCEGSEGAILKSTPDAYIKRIKKVAVEFHDNVSILKHDALAERLQALGFITKFAWNGRSPFGYLYGWQS